MAVLLETKRLIVHSSSFENFQNVYALLSDPDIMRYVGRGVKTADEVHTLLEKMMAHQEKHGFSFGDIYEKKSGKFIGRAGLIYLALDDTQPDIEVGYTLHKDFWNKGYATELAKAFVNWGFQYLPIKKIVAVTHPENEKSRRVLEKIGMYYVEKTNCYNTVVAKYEIYNKDINFNAIEIIPATPEDFSIIQNMAYFYAYDIISQCKIHREDWALNQQGTYDGIKNLHIYWEEEHRYPFIIRLNKELVGFVLINKIGSSPDVDWNIGEFFIIRKFQGKGMGRYVACQCFDQFPGTWEVAVIPGNESAYRFWRSTIKQYTHNNFQEYTAPHVYKKNEMRNLFKLKSRVGWVANSAKEIVN